MIRIFTGAKLRHSLSVNQAPQLIISAISTIVRVLRIGFARPAATQPHDLRPHDGRKLRAPGAYQVALDLKANRRRKRLKMLARGSLVGATHGPNLAAHIDEIKAVPRQLAKCFGIAECYRRLRAKHRIRDLVAILLIEMPH
jgi:hypothetical protein